LLAKRWQTVELYICLR